MTGELDQRVLEASASSEIRQVVPPRELDRAQRSLHVRVGASGCTPDPVEVLEPSWDSHRIQLTGANPAGFDPQLEPLRGMKQRGFGGPMGVLAAIEVAKQRDAQGSHRSNLDCRAKVSYPSPMRGYRMGLGSWLGAFFVTLGLVVPACGGSSDGEKEKEKENNLDDCLDCADGGVPESERRL